MPGNAACGQNLLKEEPVRQNESLAPEIRGWVSETEKVAHLQINFFGSPTIKIKFSPSL